MGYGYGPGGLACDSCGESAGRTRKRPCRFTVTHAPAPGISTGGTLRYCMAPALCPDCWERLGKGRGVHGDACRDGAARAQAREDANAERLAAGDAHVATAWGSWHDQVPDGYVGVRFVDQDGTERFRLIEEDVYRARTLERGHWLSDYPAAHPWAGPDVELEHV